MDTKFNARPRNIKILSIYEITRRALFAEFLMNENELGHDIICEKCTVTWENYYNYLSKYFDEIISHYMSRNNLVQR